MGFDVLAAINTDGCKEIPMMADATQTYFDYVNGASGYIVLGVGLTAILLGVVGRKWLSQVPGWLTGLIVAALALGSLPAILPAFGVDVGCGQGGVTENAPADNAMGATVAVVEVAL